MMPLTDESLWDNSNVEILFEDPLVAMTGVQSRWVRRRKIDIAELVDEPWILSEPNTWNYTCVVEAFKSRGLDMPKVTLMAGSMALRAQFLAGGRYVAAFAKSVAELNADRYALKILPIDWTVRPSTIAIFTLKERTLSAVAQRFIEHVRAFTRPIRAGKPVPR
jgi:DNA-binding transcriptional LysR family regulator